MISDYDFIISIAIYVCIYILLHCTAIICHHESCFFFKDCTAIMTIDITILDCCKLRKTPYPWPNDISLCIVPLKTMEKQFVTRFKSDFTSSLFFRGWYIYIYICIERYPNCNCLEIWHPSPLVNRLKARRCTRCFQTFCIVSCAGRCYGISRIHWGPDKGDWSMIFIFTKVTGWFFRLFFLLHWDLWWRYSWA